MQSKKHDAVTTKPEAEVRAEGKLLEEAVQESINGNLISFMYG